MVPSAASSGLVMGPIIPINNNWWEVFKDPILNDLINKALLTNNDLATATIKVQRAQLQSGLTNTNLTPKTTISANSSFEKKLNNNFSRILKQDF